MAKFNPRKEGGNFAHSPLTPRRRNEGSWKRGAESLHCQPPGEIKLKMFAEGSVSGFSQSLDVIYTRNVFHETVSSSERTRG